MICCKMLLDSLSGVFGGSCTQTDTGSWFSSFAGGGGGGGGYNGPTSFDGPP